MATSSRWGVGGGGRSIGDWVETGAATTKYWLDALLPLISREAEGGEGRDVQNSHCRPSDSKEN
jgi:hypothetical protein